MKKAIRSSKNKVNFCPKGFHTVTPYLVADDAIGLIEFMKKAFGGEVTFITKLDNGKVMHATVKIGDSLIMLGDTMGTMAAEPAMLFLYVENVDSVYKNAIKAKGVSLREVKTEFYGDRTGAVKDAWNNTWWIATHVEELSPAELKKRAKAFEKKQEPVEA